MQSYKYLLVNGYGWSGSSALVDFFREFNCCYVPNKEFRLIKDPHGLRDLDVQLNQSTDALNEDYAIKEFLHFINIYARISGGLHPLGLAYNVDFGSQFEIISKLFVKDLIDYEYFGYWWYLDMGTPYIRYIIDKVLSKINIYKHREHTKMFLINKSEEDFLKLVKKYIDNIFSELLKNKSYDTIVLDQAIPANRSSWGRRYFSNCKVLVVDRDPRDVYIDLINEKSLVGYDIAVNHDVTLFVDWFKKVRKHDSIDSDYMHVQFEKLILDYDKTIEEIYDYCEIDSRSHLYKKKRLIPEISANNIGTWRNYEYQKEIEIIEKELRDYIIQ